MLNAILPLIAPAAGTLMKDALLKHADVAADMSGIDAETQTKMAKEMLKAPGYWLPPQQADPLQAMLAFAFGMGLGLVIAKHIWGR